MRQAIVTRYYGPTNTKGARVLAKAAAGKLFVSWDDALTVDDNHRRAAVALADSFNWLTDRSTQRGYRLFEGALPDNTGNVYVLVMCIPDNKGNLIALENL